MSEIFLSYKSEDHENAQKIAEAIEKRGYTVWWDRIIPPGRTSFEVIEEEIDESKCVVVLWSEKSIKSKWVITEANEGDKRGILVPVLIEDVTPPLAFRMIEAAKLMDWDGTSLHHEFDLLIQSIIGILDRPFEEKVKQTDRPELKKRQELNENEPPSMPKNLKEKNKELLKNLLVDEKQKKWRSIKVLTNKIGLKKEKEEHREKCRELLREIGARPSLNGCPDIGECWGLNSRDY